MRLHGISIFPATMEREPFSQGHFGRTAASVGASTPMRRPGTPNEVSSNLPGDDVDSRASHLANTLTSPAVSRPPSTFGSASALGARFNAQAHRYFHSRRVRKGEIEKPWLDKADPKEKWVTVLPILGIVVGLAISAFLVVDGARSVVHHRYCEVLSEDFSQGFREDTWTKEVQLGGFG